MSRKEKKKTRPDIRMEFFLPRVLSNIEDSPLPTIASRGGRETDKESLYFISLEDDSHLSMIWSHCPKDLL